MPTGVGTEFCQYFWHTWSDPGGQKNVFEPNFVVSVAFFSPHVL